MFNRLRRLLSRLVPTTLEGRAAAITVLLLLIVVAVVLAWYRLEPRALPLREGITATGAVLIVLLIIWLTAIVYFGVRFWNQVEESEYPDIDEAWQAGVQALRNVGLSLHAAPLFLILGSEQAEDALVEALEAGGTHFQVKRLPGGAGQHPALRWYANESAIYLFCSRVGALSSFGRGRSEGPDSATGGRPVGRAAAMSGAAHGAPSRPRSAYTATITDISFLDEAAETADDGWPTPEPAPAQPPSILPADLGHEARRLDYLGRLLRKARRPLCGINGAVVLLPYDGLAHADNRGLQHMIQALETDSLAVHDSLRLRFPVTGLVVGMEDAEGFEDFIRALPAEYVHRRLGAGFDLRRLATGERLQLLADGMCDAFEDFVYALFARPESLYRPEDNRKLYSLLCRVRERLKPKLNIVLGKAFGVEARGDARRSSSMEESTPVFFSGCYLAATGPSAERRAFAPGVFVEKLLREQDGVEWTRTARRGHLWFKIAVWTGWAIVAVLLAMLMWETLVRS